MDSGYMTAAYGGNMMGYDNVEMLLEDVSRRMSQSNQPRYRTSISTGQRPMASMRIAKPNSTSNSPRGSTVLNRRKTVMSDSPYRKRMAMIDQQVMASNGWASNDSFQIPAKAHRPVSWHPSSQVPQQMYQQVQPSPAFPMHQDYQNYEAPSSAIYSGYTSPTSSFSPMSMPFSENDHQSYQYPPVSYPFPQTFTPDHTPIDDPMMAVQAQLTNTNQDPSMYSHFDWNQFTTNGFEDSTAPPTPDNFLPIQHPEPSFTAEEAIPYHPLSNDEPEGEELIGMGLYDNPDNSKSSFSDPQLDNYRMMSQLLGSTYRRTESTGKGLKLEETWQPPATKEEEEDDEEEDGEAEDDEEEEPIQAVNAQSTSTSVNLNTTIHGGAGWI